MGSNRAREYAPGSRSQRFRKFHRGEYVNERIAWVNTILGQVVLFFYPKDTEIGKSTAEPGPTVKVLIPRLKGPTIHWDLSNLTLEELQKLREFFDLAFDIAEPIVRYRDEVAASAVAEGDDSFSRIYRQVPQLVVRERAQPEHRESLWDRSEDVSHGDSEHGESDSLEGRVRGSGSGMADDGSEEGSVQDDRKTPD